MPLFGRPSAEDDQRAVAWRDWFAQRHPLAIASFVLGVFSLIEFGAVLVFGIAGALLGLIALANLIGPNQPLIAPTRGHYLASFGIFTSLLSLIIAAHFVYRWI